MKKLFALISAIMCFGFFTANAQTYDVTLIFNDPSHIAKIATGTPVNPVFVEGDITNGMTVSVSQMSFLFIYTQPGYEIESVAPAGGGTPLNGQDTENEGLSGKMFTGMRTGPYIVTTKVAEGGEPETPTGPVYTLNCEEDVLEFSFSDEEEEITVSYEEGVYTIVLPFDYSMGAAVNGNLAPDYIDSLEITEITIEGTENQLAITDGQSFSINTIIYSKDTTFNVELQEAVVPTILSFVIDNPDNLARIFTPSGTFEWLPTEGNEFEYNVVNGTELGIRPATDCTILSVMANGESIVAEGYEVPSTEIIYIDLEGLENGTTVSITTAEPQTDPYIITLKFDDASNIAKVGLGTISDQTVYTEFTDGMLEIEVERDYATNTNLYIYPAEGYRVNSNVYVGYGSDDEQELTFTEQPDGQFIVSPMGQLDLLFDKVTYVTTYKTVIPTPTIIYFEIDEPENLSKIFSSTSSFEWFPADGAQFEYNVDNGSQLGVIPAEGYSIVSVTADGNSIVDNEYTLPSNELIYIDITELTSGTVVSVVTAKTIITGINQLLEDNENVTIYNLQGQKVNAAQLSKGIYIINGKKTFIR